MPYMSRGLAVSCRMQVVLLLSVLCCCCDVLCGVLCGVDMVSTRCGLVTDPGDDAIPSILRFMKRIPSVAPDKRFLLLDDDGVVDGDRPLGVWTGLVLPDLRLFFFRLDPVGVDTDCGLSDPGFHMVDARERERLCICLEISRQTTVVLHGRLWMGLDQRSTRKRRLFSAGTMIGRPRTVCLSDDGTKGTKSKTKRNPSCATCLDPRPLDHDDNGNLIGHKHTHTLKQEQLHHHHYYYYCHSPCCMHV